MPTWDFSGEVATKFDGNIILPGARFTSTTKYFRDTTLGLVSHLPQVDPPPVKSMFNENIAAGVVSDVTVDQKYKRLTLYNICGGILKFFVNGDASNYIPMPNNSFWTLDNREQTIGQINLSGESTGRVDVSGDENII